MITPVVLPNQDDTTSPIHFVGWLKAEGEWVEAGEALFEVEIDKATIEIVASSSGFLRQTLAGGGEVILPGQVMGYMTSTLEAAAPEG